MKVKQAKKYYVYFDNDINPSRIIETFGTKTEAEKITQLNYPNKKIKLIRKN